nr:MAG TPA: hypothetical protein [Caudoviricetes sp.]
MSHVPPQGIASHARASTDYSIYSSGTFVWDIEKMSQVNVPPQKCPR